MAKMKSGGDFSAAGKKVEDIIKEMTESGSDDQSKPDEHLQIDNEQTDSALPDVLKDKRPKD